MKLNYYCKLYDEDVSMNSIRRSERYDMTHNLENVVLNELSYMGYEVSVYGNKGKEIDFRAVKDNKLYFVQVAYSVAEDKAYEREFPLSRDWTMPRRKSSSQTTESIIPPAWYIITSSRIFC